MAPAPQMRPARYPPQAASALRAPLERGQLQLRRSACGVSTIQVLGWLWAPS